MPTPPSEEQRREAMAGFLVCASGLSRADKERVYTVVRRLGGRADPTLTEHTTLLVSDGSPSTKYAAAVRVGIPVVFSSWAETLWSTRDSPSWDPHALVQAHRVPPLHGVVAMVIDGAGGGAAAAVGADIKAAGGRTLGASDVARPTHFVVVVRDGTARLTAAAQSAMSRHANVPVVVDEWVAQCVARRGRVDETPFLFEQIQPQRTGSASGSAFLTAAHVEDTVDGHDSTSASGDLARRASSGSLKRKLSTSASSGSLASSAVPAPTPTAVRRQLHERLERAAASADPQTLSGVSAVLSSALPPDTQALIKRALNAAGAGRLNELDPMATHFVVLTGAPAMAEAERLARFPGVRAVDAEWIAASIEAGRPLPPPSDDCGDHNDSITGGGDMDDDTTQRQRPPRPPRARALRLAPAGDPSQPLARLPASGAGSQAPLLPPPRRRTAGIEVEDNFADFFRTSGVPPPPSTPSQSTPQLFGGGGGSLVVSVPSSLPQAYTGGGDMDDAVEDSADAFGGTADVASAELPSLPADLFAGRALEFVGFPPEHLGQVMALTRRAGGTASIGSNASSAGSSSKVNGDGLVRMTVVQFARGAGPGDVTDLWFEACVFGRRFISPFEQPLLYRPPPCTLPLRAFASLRFSITGFSPVDRHVWARVVTAMGAAFSEDMDRKTTHLLVEADAAPPQPSLKLRKAASFGVTAITPAWLLACLDAGVAMPEGPFRVSAPPSTSASATTRRASSSGGSGTQASPPPLLPAGRAPPLAGVVLAVSDRLAHRREELHSAAKQLGALCQPRYDASCTHLVHEGGPKDKFAGLKAAQRAGTRIVHPAWLAAAKRMGTRPREEAFPFHFNPKRALLDENDAPAAPSRTASTDTASLTSSASSALLARAPVAAAMPARPPSLAMVETASAQQPPAHPPPLAMTTAGVAPAPVVLDDVESYVDEQLQMAASKRRRREAPARAPAPSAAVRDVAEEHSGDGIGELLPPPSLTASAAAGEEAEVHFNDATGERRRRMLLNHLINGPTEADRSPHHMHFLLTSMPKDLKDSVTHSIRQLGGRLSTDSMYVPHCTHLIVGQPNRSEKFLASMAAGKWILTPAYITESARAGQFVDEEAFEWAQDAATALRDEAERALALATRRWRLAIADPHSPVRGGAFAGWRVALLCEAEKRDGFRRLLDAGGAQVALATTPADVVAAARAASRPLDGLTHAFVGVEMTPEVHAAIRQLVPSSIALTTHEYIGDYLVREDTPVLAAYALDESDGQGVTSKRDAQVPQPQPQPHNEPAAPPATRRRASRRR